MTWLEVNSKIIEIQNTVYVTYCVAEIEFHINTHVNPYNMVLKYVTSSRHKKGTLKLLFGKIEFFMYSIKYEYIAHLRAVLNNVSHLKLE